MTPHRGVLRAARSGLNAVLGLGGVQLVRTPQPFQDYRAYIPWRETISEARRAGLSVGDYIDTRHNVPGVTQETIDRMAALGVFDGAVGRICEIGPGSGRYLQRVLDRCHPDYYEIYETAPDWGRWLVETYGVTWQSTTGWSLSATPSDTIDVVHTHKVLAGQPTLVILRYLVEMVRVLRRGGRLVFDLVTEECMSPEVLGAWLNEPGAYQHYPCMMPAGYAIDLVRQHGCSLDGTFRVPMKPGVTEYFVFTKTGSEGDG